MKHLWQKCITLPLLFSIIAAPLQAAPLDLAVQEDLERELAEIQEQITELEGQLKSTTGEKKTLTKKINKLKTEQTRLRLEIKSTTLKLEDLEVKMTETRQAITEKEKKSEELKAELSSLIRSLYHKSRRPLIIELAEGRGLSATFGEMQQYEFLTKKIKDIAREVATVRSELAVKQQTYEADEEDTRELLTLATVQQSSLSSKLAEQS